MHALGAVARNCVHDSPTERSRDGDLLHAHAGVAIRLCSVSLPKQVFLHHLLGKQDGLSVEGDTWLRQLRQGEGGGGVWTDC